jgi:hypothetical protein
MMTGHGYGGFLGLLVLIADVYAIVKVAQSGAAPLAKALWIVAIIVLPVIGFLLWLLFGPKG